MKHFVIVLIALCSLTTVLSQQQQGKIKGKITTSDGKPAPYVNITIKETKQNIVASEDGSFTINTDKECTCTIVVSFNGLKTLEQKVNIQNGKTVELNFKLQENAEELNEVVVTSFRGLNDK